MYYVMYLRKSRADIDAEARGEGETLARHRAQLSQLAQLNGHAIAEIYAEVVSGETIAQRPQMQRLLMDIANADCAGVYVMEVERLARGDTMDQGRVSQAFLYSSTRIITPAKVYDPKNEFDLEYFEFGLFMSRREYKTINRRIQAGRIQSAKEGKFPSSIAAYGYNRVKIRNGKGYTLEIVPQQAAVVRRIFDCYKSGLGVEYIARQLDALCVPPGGNAHGWNASRIYRMLRNEVYIGMIRWGKVLTSRSLTKVGVQTTRTVSGDYKLYKGLHPPIVDPAVFEAVQRKLSGAPMPLARGAALSNPLAGLVRCKACASKMIGQAAYGKTPPQLLCKTKGCATVANARPAVEQAILDELRTLLHDFHPNLTPPAPDARDASAQMQRRFKAQLRKLDKQMSALHDLLEDGTYDAATFKARSCALQQKTMQIKAAWQACQTPPPAPSGDAPTVFSVVDLYCAASVEQKNRLLKALLLRVVYSKSKRGTTSPASNPNGFVLDVYPLALPNAIVIPPHMT